MNVEERAGTILQRGVDFELKQRNTEALVCYQEGLQMLLDIMKEEINIEKKKFLRNRVEEFIKRAERLKIKIDDAKENDTFHEQIRIEDDSKGHSYENLFGRFLNEDVVCIRIEDPYIRVNHQRVNFLRFCELVVKRCKNVKFITLVTSHEIDNEVTEQTKCFSCLAEDLLNYKIKLSIEYSSTLHDRHVYLSSGWVIKIGRGLDIYKPLKSKYCVGFFDLNLRRCHQTVVDIFYMKSMKHIFP